jgi:hypothetical protein
MGKYNIIYIPYSITGVVTIFFFVVLYYFDEAYTHQFKINDHPWPWKQTSEKWSKMLSDILYVCVNSFL